MKIYSRLLAIACAVLLAACDPATENGRLVGELASDRIELTAEFAEPVTEILVAEGETVSAGQVLMRPRWVTVCDRSGSYIERTDAWANRSVAPRLAGCSGLPSTLVGRPMWLSASSPVA